MNNVPASWKKTPAQPGGAPSSLVTSYQEIADLTSPICAGTLPEGQPRCRAPQSCCDSRHCELAEIRLTEVLKEPVPDSTGHDTLRFMGPEGCILQPYQRPMCAVHACPIAGLGFFTDLEMTRRYFELRTRISQLEYTYQQQRDRLERDACFQEDQHD